MRGKVPFCVRGLSAGGITPAYAGKRHTTTGTACRQGDHPRVCGEKVAIARLLPCLLGSPPRMRGKGNVPGKELGTTRITPAYAGKSPAVDGKNPSPGDHPRVCGEKAQPRAGSRRVRGSPPRMRGKDRSAARASNGNGITPAYAGKSLTIQKMTTRSRDHPRVCGEKCMSRCRRRRAEGSPPRMRGKVVALLCGISRTRITPAYAGKSGRPGNGRPYPQDHPRVCGEKPSRKALRNTALGSPPRMRGKD